MEKTSGHVINSKLVTEPCKQFCCCKIDPKHDQKFIEHNFRHFFKNCTPVLRIPALHTSVYITFLTDKQRNKYKLITQFLCLIFKDIKDWLTNKKSPFKK